MRPRFFLEGIGIIGAIGVIGTIGDDPGGYDVYDGSELPEICELGGI